MTNQFCSKIIDKYLDKINILNKQFNDNLNNKDSALKVLLKIRNIHGFLLNRYNNFNKLNDDEKMIDDIINDKYDKNEYIKLSCYYSIIKTINDIIIENEMKLLDKPLDLFKGESILSVYDDKQPTLFLFYNPHCPACIKIKPEWNQIKNNIMKYFRENKKTFNIKEIDISDKMNENIVDLFKIEYIPTIIFIESKIKKNPKIKRIEGYINFNEIADFISKTYLEFEI